MIGFNRLGELGRLGNQMFQYAALRGIAATKNYAFCIPEAPSSGEGQRLAEVFELSALRHLGHAPANDYVEKQAHYDPEFVRNCPDDISLVGFFQNPRYFAAIQDSLRNDFRFHPSTRKRAQELLGTQPTIALHVRRGDFLLDPRNFPPCDISYYRRALTLVPQDLPLMVVSDDIPWCRQQELFSAARCRFSDAGDDAVDLCLISLCRFHIIANSSFSWWGAWLAQSERVIGPRRWFGEQADDPEWCRNHNPYPPHWLRI